MATIDFDGQHQNIKRWVTYAVIIIGAAVAAPVAYLALEGIMAIAACIIAIMLIVNFAPVVGTYIANKRVAAMKAAVEANPIETMENLLVDKTQALHIAEGNITDFETEIRNFDDQLDDFKRQYPDEASTYMEIDAKMKEALTGMQQEMSDARRELKDFQLRINKANAIYRMALAAAKVEKLSGTAQTRVFAKIKEQVAFDVVRTSLNKAFSNLDLALARRNDARVMVTEAPKPKQLVEAMPDMPRVPASAITERFATKDRSS